MSLPKNTSTVPVIVVGGYLGAGKTTLINELLTQTQSRIAVIVNDFGSINIDASLIAQHNSDTIELTNGCICCSLGSSLADTMLTLSDREIQPDLVVVEASGVADPGAVAANAHLAGFHLSGILVLVDAINAGRTANSKLTTHTFHQQISTAHLLAITKSDVASQQQLQDCVDAIHQVPHSASVIHRKDVSAESLIGLQPPTTTHVPSHEHALPFRDSTLNIPPGFDKAGLQKFFDALPIHIVRAKGIVALHGEHFLVQRVGTHTAITPTSLDPTGIVAISTEYHSQ